MKPERYALAREHFLAAGGMTPAERKSYLARACGDDAELRSMVEELLAHHERAEGFLETPAMGAPPGSASHPEKIGHYRVLGILGEGGMGVVYRAEQESPRREVALKVLAQGLASPSRLKRFEHEALILGRLRHPGIAQVFEAGTADTGSGMRPFFAMELVRGLPITHWAASRRLGPRERIELLALACDAVHHAHVQGVVHRDLKPANVLVDEHGQPKVLDFGVARATDGDLQLTTLRTRTGELVGTLAYMSPEQAQGDAARVDARSDVYALGVILYELLAGRRPLELEGLPVPLAARAVVEDDPSPLGARDRALRGDLETVAAKALAKEPARRYASAAELAADLRRHLADEPVLARPASTIYRAGKFARRHRALVAAVAALSLGVVGTTWQAVRATRQRDLAQREARRSGEMLRFLQEMLGSIDPETARGRDVSVLREMLDAAAARIERELAGEPEVQAELRGTIGVVYTSIGLHEQAGPHLRASLELRRRLFGERSLEYAEGLSGLVHWASEMDDDARAEALARDALAIRAARLGEEHPATARATINLANALTGLARFDEAEALLRRGLDLGRRHAEEREWPLEGLLSDLAGVLIDKGAFEEAEALLVEALELLRARGGEGSLDEAMARTSLGAALHEKGDLRRAEQEIAGALGVFRRLLSEDHPWVVKGLGNLAVIRWRLGDSERAEALWREALSGARSTFGDGSLQAAVALNGLAAVVRERRTQEEAGSLFREALAIRERLLPGDSPLLAQSLMNLADVLDRRTAAAEAEALYRRAIGIYERKLGAEHENTASALNSLGLLRHQTADLAGAEELLARALEIRRRILPAAHPQLADSLLCLGAVRMDGGDHAGAETLFRECLAARKASLPGHWRVAEARVVLGRALSLQGRYEEAEVELVQGMRELEQARPGGGYAGPMARRFLVELYEMSGEWEKAEELRAADPEGK